MNLTLRIFCCVLISASFGACSSYKKDGPVKTVSNSEYRTPTVGGPVPRNPDMRVSAAFTAAAGVTQSRGPTDQPVVAMTFDDGPHPQNTPRLLDMLRARNIKATFYVIGRSVDNYPQIVRRIVAEGHEIGNHTYTHSNLTKLSDSAVLGELTRTRDSIVSASGVQPRTMRPPYGALLQRQRAMIHQDLGYPTVLWSVDPRDWQRPGPSVVTSRILSNAHNGAIILAHDLHSPSVDAMPATLDGLLRKGFRFVTVSQLIALKESSALASTETASTDS